MSSPTSWKRSKSTSCTKKRSPTRARTSVPEVHVLQRDAEVGLLARCDDCLQVVALLPAHADLVALDRGRHALHAEVLHEAVDGLADVLGDPGLERHVLSSTALRCLLDLLWVERLERHLAADHLLFEHLVERLQAVLGRRREHELF